MRLLTKEQSSRLDKYSINKYNISQDLLMKSAANHCADEIIKYLLKNQRLKKILIICGKGNNGGDAIYTAKLLQKENLDIHVHFLIEKNEIQGLSLKYHNQYTKANGSISYGYKLTKYKNIDVIVDGILGIGFKGSLRPEIINWVKWINSLKVYIIALDLPSGLNADNGVVLPVAIKASQTITFGYGKIGLYINEGKDYSGIIKTVDIGLNKKVLFELGGFECHLYNSKTPKQFLNNVPNNTYKQKRGKVLIIGGSVGMTGAAVLATYGSLRVGAGVVITVCPSSLSNIYEKYILEGMTLACEDDGRGYLSIKNYDIIMNKVDWADSIVIGPGLGLNNSTKTLVAKLIKSIQKPIVIDADALNGFNKFMLDSSNMVITPHLGEFSKIVNKSRKKIINNYLSITSDFMSKYNGVAVIKHVPACIFYRNKFIINSTGNSGLATAGSGDVLSGMIGSFIAQGINNFDAASLACFLHGKSADNIVKEYGKRGLISSDLPLEVAKIINTYEKS